jgi:hypothetical protein
MLDLDAREWRALRVPGGDARNVPRLIRSFRLAPSPDAFDRFFAELTGDGDIAVHDSFYAALPHAIQMVGQLHGEAAEEALAQLGWAIALCGGEVVPAHLAGEFEAATREVAAVARSMLRRETAPRHRAWIVAALAAARGRHGRALHIIDRIP